MRKNRLFVLGIITMFVAILSLTLVSGTMARYTSKVSGESTARVAKWAWVVGDKDITDNSVSTVEFDLFDGYTDSNVDVDGEGDEVVIAPGTTGQFQFNITNNSEVNATFTIVLSETTNNGIPVQYSLSGADDSWVDDITDLNVQMKNQEIGMNGGNSTAFTVYWRWVFKVDDAQDGSDTNLGFNANLGDVKVVVKAELTFDQKD